MPAQPLPLWITSSYSGSPNNECVECATNVPDCVLVRDSKDPEGPLFAFSRRAWSEFTTAVREDTLRPR